MGEVTGTGACTRDCAVSQGLDLMPFLLEGSNISSSSSVSLFCLIWLCLQEVVGDYGDCKPEVVESPSLEMFKSHLDMVLGNGSRWPCLIKGLDQRTSSGLGSSYHPIASSGRYRPWEHPPLSATVCPPRER